MDRHAPGGYFEQVQSNTRSLPGVAGEMRSPLAVRPGPLGRVHLRCLVRAGRWRAACQLRLQVMGRFNSYLTSIPRRTPVSSLSILHPTPCTSPSPAGPVRKDPARCVRRSQCGPDRWVVCICAACEGRRAASACQLKVPKTFRRVLVPVGLFL